MLLQIFGPPAVGKMTVARAVCARSSFRLFHNHMTVEPLLEVFGHGTRAFNVLNREFRTRILQEATRDGLDLAWTVVWALDSAQDLAVAQHEAAIVDDDVAYVELRAPLATRLERNRTEQRLLHKASKRDVEWSDSNVREMDERWQMTSEDGTGLWGEWLAAHRHLVIDNTHLTPDAVAEQILTWLGR